jgi:selenocysteine lyase
MSKSCHSGEFRASKILLTMGREKKVASNAVRLSVGRETSRKHIDLALEDLKEVIANISC